jgi:WD40 repeat protein
MVSTRPCRGQTKLGSPDVINTGSVIGYVAFSPNGQYLALTGQVEKIIHGAVRLYAVGSWNEISSPSIESAAEEYDALGPDGWSSDSLRLFTTGDARRTDGNNGALVGYFPQGRLPRLEREWEFPWSIQEVSLISDLPYGNEFALYDSSVELVDFSTGRIVRQYGSLGGSTVNAPICIYDNKLLVGLAGFGLAITDVRTCRILGRRRLPFGGHHCALSSDRSKAVVEFRPAKNSGCSCQVFSASDLTPIGKRMDFDPFFRVDRLVFSHDGSEVFALLEQDYQINGNWDANTILVTGNVRTGIVTPLYRPIASYPDDMAISNDGRYLACSTWDGLYVWDLTKK